MKGVENVVYDQLSRLDNFKVTQKEKTIIEDFLNEHLLAINERSWFEDMANYKATKSVPEEYTSQQKKKFYKEDDFHLWDDPYSFKVSPDRLDRTYVAGVEANSIIWNFHNSCYGGHHSSKRTVAKVYQCGFQWPNLFKDCKLYVKNFP